MKFADCIYFTQCPRLIRIIVLFVQTGDRKYNNIKHCKNVKTIISNPVELNPVQSNSFLNVFSLIQLNYHSHSRNLFLLMCESVMCVLTDGDRETQAECSRDHDGSPGCLR